jgi:hypothetical protein
MYKHALLAYDGSPAALSKGPETGHKRRSGARQDRDKSLIGPFPMEAPPREFGAPLEPRNLRSARRTTRIRLGY